MREFEKGERVACREREEIVRQIIGTLSGETVLRRGWGGG
jgi:hypothetical protein